MSISQEELMERRRRAKDLLQNIQKDDLTPEEKKAMQQCADDMGQSTIVGSLTGLALSYTLTRVGRVPLLPKLFFNIAAFAFGGYLGMKSASDQCVRRLTALESSNIGDLVKLSMTNTPLSEIHEETYSEDGGVGEVEQQRSTIRSLPKRHDHHIEKVDREDTLEHKPLSSKELLLDEDESVVKKGRGGGPRRNQYGDIIDE